MTPNAATFRPPSELAAMTTDDNIRLLAAKRWRVAIVLTAAMIVNYFGFIALIAYDKPLMATMVTRGLTLGILLGALVIVVSWILTWIYVRWANTHYDAELRRVGAGYEAQARQAEHEGSA